VKAIILAGGLGTRLAEETHNKPKPMVKIGELTLIEHIMGIYARSGINDFVIATGYLHEVIDKYFYDFKEFNVTALYTGQNTQTGGRIKQVLQTFPGENFCATYGDGLGNIDVNKSIKFHKKHGGLVTVTAVRPTARFGRLKLKNDLVVSFGEKLQSEEGWINGGFFVLDREVIDYISGDDTPFEGNPLRNLTEKKELFAYKHFGFWSPVDTLREKHELEVLWNNGAAPWTVFA
jgi:glucose-1-phosphate cytidylyltransferase